MVLVSQATTKDCRSAARRRHDAAERYRPDRIRLLIIAQMPPDDLDRYFYFESVPRADYLFRAVVPHLLGEEPARLDKRAQLRRLCESGVFVIDLKPAPCDHAPVDSFADDLVGRVLELHPEHELCALRPDSIIRQDRRQYLRVDGKGLRERMVPLPPTLIRGLDRYLRTRPADTASTRLFLSLRRAAHGDYQALTTSGVLQLVHPPPGGLASPKRIHPHAFRHAWMTEMLRRGMNPLQLSRIAGASLQVIQAHHEHLTQDDAYDAMLQALAHDR